MLITNKKNKGLTLIEVVVVLAIIGFVIAAAGNAMISMFQAHIASERTLTDQHNVRLALLNITRQVRHGVEVDVQYPGPSNWLQLTYAYGTPDAITVRYEIAADGLLRRDHIDGPGNIASLVPFIPVELNSFLATRLNDEESEASDGNWLQLTLVGTEGAEVETMVSIYRIAQ